MTVVRDRNILPAPGTNQIQCRIRRIQPARALRKKSLLVISRVKLSHSNHLILRENVVDALTAFMLTFSGFENVPRNFFLGYFFLKAHFFSSVPRGQLCASWNRVFLITGQISVHIYFCAQ